MRDYFCKFLNIIFLTLLVGACSQSGPIVDEEEDAAFQRGRSFLKVGKEEETPRVMELHFLYLLPSFRRM